jgi:uncharacterized protein (DUF1684 family)
LAIGPGPEGRVEVSFMKVIPLMAAAVSLATSVLTGPLAAAGSSEAPLQAASSASGASIESAAAPKPLDTPAWRAQRERQLLEPDGWLAVAGLFFLHARENTVGTDPASDVRLPPGSGPPRAGRILVEGGAATFMPNPGVAARLNGTPIDGRSALRLADAAQKRRADRTEIGRISFHLHASGERLAVRLRDPESRYRVEFAGLRWFDIDEAWRLTGRFVPYDAPRTRPIQNILGDIEPTISPGEVEFVVAGTPVRLVALASGDRLWFVFRDGLAGQETYRIRFLYADAPSADGRVTLDFNRAYNPPCAFNPYTTCPLPPSENRLAIAIPAGEKLYVPRGTSSDRNDRVIDRASQKGPSQ